LSNVYRKKEEKNSAEGEHLYSAQSSNPTQKKIVYLSDVQSRAESALSGLCQYIFPFSDVPSSWITTQIDPDNAQALSLESQDRIHNLIHHLLTHPSIQRHNDTDSSLRGYVADWLG